MSAQRAGWRRGVGPRWALPARLEGRLLRLACTVWLLVAVTLAVLVTGGFVRAFRHPELAEVGTLTQLFTAIGLDARLMIAIALVAPIVVTSAVCALVFWRRSYDPMALLFTMAVLLLFTFSSRALHTYSGEPVLEHVVSVVFVFAFAIVGLVLVLALFPDGRFAPQLARWLLPAIMAVVVAFPDAVDLFEAMAAGQVSSRGRTFILAWSGVALLGLLAQAYRYRHASGPTERRQVKWVILPLGSWMAVLMLVGALPVALLDLSDRWFAWVLLVGVVPFGILFPVGVGVAVLRYRLYAIDRIISRTVSYTVLTGVLVGVYLAAVLGGSRLLAPLAAGSELSVAAATLAAAALFAPARRRIQAAVDRRFNRARYDADQVVAAFRAHLRHDVDLAQVGEELLAATARAVQPLGISLWVPDLDAPVTAPGRSGGTTPADSTMHEGGEHDRGQLQRRHRPTR